MMPSNSSNPEETAMMKHAEPSHILSSEKPSFTAVERTSEQLSISVLSLPWQPQTLNADDNMCLLENNISESEWNDMRKYLTILACSNITYSMDAELQEVCLHG
ncbi:unnamed protein product [Trichobilharzia regenti]|nr:unnamed protein product [Trichobilharzia regenti]